MCRAEGILIAAGEEGCLTGLGSLQSFLVGAVEELATLLSRRAISDFNDWLVPALYILCPLLPQLSWLDATAAGPRKLLQHWLPGLVSSLSRSA